MNATLYTGTSAAQSITNGAAGASFQPDMVWIKSRSSAYDHNVFDSVRGVYKQLVPNATYAENNYTTSLTAFNSNGFSVGSDIGTNNSGSTFVAWQWKAGGTAVSNTAGSITSQVSANTTSGFSVVTYTGNGSGTASVGHGLSVSPSMVIIKNRTSGSASWPVYHGSIPSLYLTLNTTDAGTSGQWISASSSLVSFSTLSSWTNTNSNNYVAYCWAPIAGYSAFGSYTGNGSADGPFVYLGFRPKFVLIKCSSGAGTSWIIYDSSRNTYNATTSELYPNTTGAETNAYAIDFLSNGFKIRNGTTSNLNDSGSTQIYACFAENPFKYANARQETQTCHTLQKLKTVQ